ncbi:MULTISPECIES: hypothetical protein [unclassified Streptomyces]|uniref:hypothetical protein n=1 Tax=unclassified Streptomyces TaxID=2593676 RepID=UPI001F046BDA|nr:MULTISPECIES: hypothetical protein [unclassified Streptomyces]MCH0566648.1 hypothetical protein [Streptomyces sp. MUM 2J]MCH0572826.1 hypothetical protein [Streptomyces sp. MUM 136J]
MPRSRRSRAALAAVAACGLLATAAACGDTGGLRGAGATPTAISPVRLWPSLTPASSPAFDIDEVKHEAVEGVAVPGDDIRKVDPVAVVRAEIEADPEDYSGSTARYRETVARLDDCGADGDRARCPVLKSYYRDLTGDGHDELTLGFRQLPGPLTAVRVYTVEKHQLVQVMSWEDAVSGVELAGRSLIIRSPSDVAGYDYRLQWTWDPDQRTMLLTHDEMQHTGGSRAPAHPRRPAASPSAGAR